MCRPATTLSDTGCSSVDTRMTMPFQKPKATYFQLAPCQMPMTRNVMSEATAVGRTLPMWLPRCCLAWRPQLRNAFEIDSG